VSSMLFMTGVSVSRSFRWSTAMIHRCVVMPVDVGVTRV
jgi:hypothetical protein